MKKISHELKKQKYDLVHFSSSASISLIKDIFSVKIAHKHGARAIMHFHFGRIPQIIQSNNWETYLLRKVIALADAVIVLDEMSYSALHSYGCDKVYKLANPLALSIQQKIQNLREEERNKNEILFVGHVVESKGVFELLEAIKGLENVTLNIIGKGSVNILDKLKKELLNCSNSVNFLGVQPIEKVIEYMMTCSVFVLPTYTEGFPNVIIESMACGCPIVTTDVGAIPEMLDLQNGNDCGICVKPRQIIELREAIAYMLNDDTYAKTCGVNAQKRVTELYTVSEVWNKLSFIWKEIIEK